MTNTQIDAKVFEIDMLEAQIKELKALADARKAELKAELDERKVEMVDTGVNRVWYDVYTRKAVDTKALKADGLYDTYAKESTVVTFKITKVADTK